MSNINPDPFTTRPEIEGTFGVVTSTHWIATAVGMSILEKGGNAFDAGVATAFTLQVVEPHLNGPGGEVPVIGYDAGRGEAFVLDGQGPAPQAATVAAFGTWMLLLADRGRLRLREVMEHAIGYARDGYPVVPGISAGACLRQRSNASGQRGLNAQPGGGSIGLGISPLTGIRWRPDIARSGTAPSSILV